MPRVETPLAPRVDLELVERVGKLVSPATDERGGSGTSSMLSPRSTSRVGLSAKAPLTCTWRASMSARAESRSSRAGGEPARHRGEDAWRYAKTYRRPNRDPRAAGLKPRLTTYRSTQCYRSLTATQRTIAPTSRSR